MSKRTTFDQLAISVLLSPAPLAARERQLRRLAQHARQALEGRLECPECGDMGPHDDNNVVGPERAYSCRACGMCFEPHHDDG